MAAVIRARLAGPLDLDFILQDGHTSTEIILRKIEQQEVFVVELDGQLAGYARIEYLWSQIPYLALIKVEAALRGRGLARALLETIQSFLGKRGHLVLYSSSQADEPEPQAWHRHMGFEECGFIAGINDGGVGEVFFRKQIGIN